MSKLITEQDLQRAADALDCQLAAVKAVRSVESSGAGFLLDGVRPRILFEAHQFSRLTGHRYDVSHPTISSRRWNAALYAKGPTADVRGQREHDRLDAAAALDRNAALQSASWGLFQIMGFNFDRCGFVNVQTMINAMYAGEGLQLDAFVRFVKSQGLADELQRADWAGFASIYNGPGYAANEYDIRLAKAFHAAGGR